MENVTVLIEKSRNGDRDAFGRFVEKYQGMVSAVTLNIVGDYAQSEDLAQETFLTAWKKLSELRDPEKSASWLYGIARYVSLQWREKQRKNLLHNASELDEQKVSDRENALQTRHQEQSLQLVWSSVKELPETLREPLLLYYRYSRSVAEIAESMQLSEQAVRQRLSRGRKMLKAEVEKQVETVLEMTRPNEHFVAAVLAAIPVLVTGPHVLAASSAGVAVAESASSGSGSPILAALGTSFNVFVSHLGPFLAIVFGVFLGVWNLVRHAPSCAARRLMIKATLEYCVLCGALYLGYVITLLHFRGGHSFIYEYLAYPYIILAPVLVILNTIRVNRHWRQIVEYDSGISSRKPGVVTWRSIFTLLAVAILILAVHNVWFAYTWFTFMKSSLSITQKLILLSVPGAMMIFVYCGWRISRNEAAFEAAPPRLPNLLQILTGEQPCPKGFRNRVNFWGDLTGFGVGLFLMQCCYIGWYLWFSGLPVTRLPGFSIGNGSYLSLVLSLTTYMAFVVFFAGIPRRRYWGMIVLAATLFMCNAFLIYYTQLWLYVERSEFLIVFGLHFWYTLCIALYGVAGLWVFRKKPQSIRE